MPPAPQQGQSDNHMAPMWIVIGLFIVIALIWYFLRGPILQGFLYIKLWEIKLLDLIIPSPNFFQFANLNLAQEMILRNGPLDLSFLQLTYIANTVGDFLAGPVIILCIVFAIILMRKSTGHRFRRTYTMKTLLKLESTNWPQTTPVVGLDLVSEDIDQGPWAMAMTPMQFAKKNKLIRVHKQTAQEGKLSRDLRLEATLIKPRALQFFTRQVGPLWRGPDALNMHTKALYAAFAARAANDIEGARNLLTQIAASSRDKKINFSGVQALLDKHRNNPLVVDVGQRHAFVLTVMASMLVLARSVGVQASADFLWLKIIDRRLWFMLNAVGRQTPTVEVAGAFCHWLVEKKLGRKLVTPVIDEAVNGLELALSEMIYTPDE